jgi:hypothetical protein
MRVLSCCFLAVGYSGLSGSNTHATSCNQALQPPDMSDCQA